MSVNENDVKKRLDLYVSEVSGSTRSGAQVLIDNGCVLVNGKEENGRLMMPLSITCHHAATDGYHVNQFLTQLQAEADQFDRYIS